MEKPRIQDDLFFNVNGETLDNLVIPDDKPMAGGFAQLEEDVEKIMMTDFAAFNKGELEIPQDLPEVKEAVKLYRKILDASERNEAGITPALKYLNKVKEISSLEEFNEKALSLLLECGMPMPFNLDVQPDMKNTEVNSFCFWGPSMILPDTSYYAEDNEAGKALLKVYEDMISKLLDLADLNDDEKKEYVRDTLEFDRNISKVSKSNLEWADYVNDYNPMPVTEVEDFVKPFDLNRFLSGLYGDDVPEKLIIRDPKSIKEFSTYFNEGSFTQYLHWAYVNLLIKASASLSEEIHTLGTTFTRALYGIAKDPVLEKQAYEAASALFSEPIGIYYGRKYFGEEAKADVVSMVKQIIEAYKERVDRNEILERSTRDKAIKKLNTITIKMGYPDKADPYYSLLKVDEEKTLLDIMCDLSKEKLLYNLKKLPKPVDPNEWLMPGHMVNACYNPFSNDITFPSGILQAPFYSLKQSVSENLGGIGAVIAHEISHAFDNNGAQFDEKGNLNKWWTEKDYENFKERTKAMIEAYDGIEFYEGKLNGELIVSENIADNGGMAVTLHIMEKKDDANYQEYFRNWGRIWCMKTSPEYRQMALVYDVHAPNEIRANYQPRNFKEWYEAFDVTESDRMYTAPDKRIIIW
ncbi:MAG: M13 family metallopeptidase [Erysipelotrichaceae bacterium]|nr:M13 family metallopeptidase [Erysipelotrichaceae bacterium]